MAPVLSLLMLANTNPHPPTAPAYSYGATFRISGKVYKVTARKQVSFCRYGLYTLKERKNVFMHACAEILATGAEQLK